jgi:uncharacterized protein
MNRKKNLKTKEEIVEIITRDRKVLSERFHITEIGLFGSYLRNEQDKNSDVDVLIDYDRKKKFSLYDLIDLKEYLTKKIGINVDVALKRTLKPVIGYYILKEVEYI